MALVERDLAPVAGSSHINWKLIGFGVILPAILTGILSLAPALWQSWTAPKASLGYGLAFGPEISDPRGHLRIYSLTIENSGKVVLSNVRYTTQIADGHILNAAGIKSPGLQTSYKLSKDGAEYRVAQMFPGESISHSLMVSASSPTPSLSVNVRSDQSLGVLTENAAQAPSRGLLFGSLVPMIAALAALTLSLILVRLRMKPLLNDKETIISFIAGLIDSEELKEIVYGGHSLTYARASDAFLLVSRSTPHLSNRCIAAQKSLLLVWNVVDESVDVIKTNLQSMVPTLNEQDLSFLHQDTIKLQDAPQLRRRILEVFNENTPPVGAQG